MVRRFRFFFSSLSFSSSYPIADGVPSTAAGWAEKAQEAHHEAAKKLLQKFGHVAKDKGRKVTLLLAHGVPAEAIVEEANSRKVDTIVIGRRHLGSVHRFFVGSASQYVVEHAEANVIVVHDRTPEEA